MLRSIASISLGGGLQEKVYAAAAARFDAIEISESDLNFFEGSPADLLKQLNELRMSVSLFQGLTDFEALPHDAFEQALDRAERKFDLMGELGASLLLVTSTTDPSASDDEALAVAHLHSLAERAARRGIRVGFEALAWGKHVRTSAEAWRLVSRANHPHLGMVLNSFQSLVAGESPAAIAAIPGDKIFLVQLADAPRLQLDLATLSRHFRCFPGQGSLDIGGFMAQVLKAGYTGPVSLEVQNDEFLNTPPRQLAMDGMRSLTFVEEQLWRANASRDQTRFAHVDPPALPEKEAVGFIEFAVSAATQGELAGWLNAMGFGIAGRHRTKDVTLYRQGDVLIVLNAGTDTFAHYYHQLHGTSVCTVGLNVADPAGLLARADLYHYKRYQERTGQQEYRMPAVRAPDGSLIHLLDDHYDPYQDFIPVEADTSTATGVMDVDHIVRAVPAGQFDSWILFYRALLGLEPEASLELPDPHGFVRSQALHDHSNRVRLPLTFSESSRTSVSRSLSTFGGAGVNQIAFGTPDIFSTVTRMRQNRVLLLRIPANYYRELRAEQRVPAAMADKLEEYNVLYDRDGHGGEFLHAYTEYFSDRFFFEVVQRINGYDRYGEINAPVRMAAQAKRRVHEIVS